MKRLFGLSSVVTTAVLAAGLAPAALASDGSAFGRHVAGCAQEHLGQRAAPPAVICTMPDGTTMTFPNFGAMVHHMQGL